MSAKNRVKTTQSTAAALTAGQNTTIAFPNRHEAMEYMPHARRQSGVKQTYVVTNLRTPPYTHGVYVSK